MVKLTGLIKTITCMVLLNKAVRGGLIAVLINSMNHLIRSKESSVRSSNRPSGLLALLEIVLASILAMRTKSYGTAGKRDDLDIGGLLSDLMKGMMSKNSNDMGRIIECNDYTVIEEKR
jgi:hypothetical protein